ncbi:MULTISPECIES: hemerythrin domain-containing protein [unclassified Nonomuraea]|uniref:hemerythrin domain-containing protein n=1 Tax=Nonomuraea sp. NPDC003804 TaxID=3154547 RepID=UPI0033A9EB51
MTSDAISMITADHRDVERLFDRLKKDTEDRPALLAELAAKFVAHSRGEEELIYPEIAKTVPSEKDQVREGAEEHHEAERMLLSLLDVDPDTPKFDTLLDQLVQAVNHHVQEEESEILPALRKAVPRRRLEELGRAFSERKAQEIQHGLPVGNGRKSGKRTRAGGGGSTGMSKEELYHRAQEAKIPGRSSMTKEELTKALQKSGKA